MPPSQQRLEAGYAVVVEPNTRLEVNFELLFFDGLMKIHLELATELNTRIHVAVVKAEGLSSLRLHPIEGQISLVNKFIRISVGLRPNRDAYARADNDSMPIYLIGHGQGLNNPFGKRRRLTF